MLLNKNIRQYFSIKYSQFLIYDLRIYKDIYFGSFWLWLQELQLEVKVKNYL